MLLVYMVFNVIQAFMGRTSPQINIFSVGFAISHDQGVTFEKLGNGPVLTATLHEPFLVCDAFVAVFENQFHTYPTMIHPSQI